MGGCVLPLPLGVDQAEVTKVEMSIDEVETVDPGFAVALVSATGGVSPIPADDNLFGCLDEDFKAELLPTKVILPTEYEAIQIAKKVPLVRD